MRIDLALSTAQPQYNHRALYHEPTSLSPLHYAELCDPAMCCKTVLCVVSVGRFKYKTALFNFGLSYTTQFCPEVEEGEGRGAA